MAVSRISEQIIKDVMAESVVHVKALLGIFMMMAALIVLDREARLAGVMEEILGY